MEVELRVNKKQTIGEVADTTSYTGAKMDGDPKAFERISMVEEDRQHLERFWDESRAEVCRELRGLIADERMDGDDYVLELTLSNSFDEKLKESMRINLRSYFVHNITAKWYAYTNKGEAGAYADKAATLLDDVHRKAVWKKKPTRPMY